MTTWARVLGWGRQAVLTGGAVLGVACLLLVAGAALLGLRPLVFLSGSMSPTIDTGALGLSREVPAADLRVGDVVSVPTGGGERVTHRIVTVTHRGDGATLALKGDANDDPDARTYVVDHADRVLVSVPRLGFAVGWLTGPAGLFVLGLYATFLLSVLLRPSPPGDGSGGPDGPGSAREPESEPEDAAADEHGGRVLRRGPVSLALGVLGAALLPLPVTPTLAAWGDTAQVTGSGFTVGLGAPGSFRCAAGYGKRTTFSWTAVGSGAGASYVVYYGTGGTTTTTLAPGTLSFTTPDNRDTGTVWVVAQQTFGGTVWTSPDTAHQNYTPGVCTPA